MKPLFNPYAKKKPGPPSSAAGPTARTTPPNAAGAPAGAGGSVVNKSNAAAASLSSSSSSSSSTSVGHGHTSSIKTLAPRPAFGRPNSSEQPGIGAPRQLPMPSSRGGGGIYPSGGGFGGGGTVVGAGAVATNPSTASSQHKPLSLKAKLKADIEKIKRENQHKKLLKQQQQQQQQQQRGQANPTIIVEQTKDAGGHPPSLQRDEKENVGTSTAIPTTPASSSSSAAAVRPHEEVGPRVTEEVKAGAAAAGAAAPPVPPPQPARVAAEVPTPPHGLLRPNDRQLCDTSGRTGKSSEASGSGIRSVEPSNTASPTSAGTSGTPSPTTTDGIASNHRTPSDAVPFVTPSAAGALSPNCGSNDAARTPNQPGAGSEAVVLGAAPSNTSPTMDATQVRGGKELPADEATRTPPASKDPIAATMTHAEMAEASTGRADGAVPTPRDLSTTMPATITGSHVGGSESDDGMPRRDFPPAATAAPPAVTNPAHLMSQQLLAAQHVWQQQHQLMQNSVYGYWNQPLFANPSHPTMYPMYSTSFAQTAAQAPVGWPSAQLHYPMMPATGGTYIRPSYGFPWNPWSTSMPLGGHPSAPQLSRAYAPTAPRSKNSPSSVRLKQPGSNVLAAKPLEAPSPYSYTHDIQEGTVVLTKKPTDPDRASFGVTLRLDVQSALVPREWLIAHNYLSVPTLAPNSAAETVAEPAVAASPDLTGRPGEAASASSEALPVPQAVEESTKLEPSNPAITNDGATQVTTAVVPIKRQAPRRKRWHFAVLAVQDASKHNSRGPSGVGGSAAALQAGDVILKIDGKTTEGLTFQQAVALLRDFDRVDEDGVARCPVVVARRKPPVVSTKQSTATSRIAANPMTRKAPLTPAESVAFVANVLKVTTDPLRLLGKPISDDNLRSIAQGNPALSSLSLDFLKGVWRGITSDVRTKIDADAVAHWTSSWQKETNLSPVPGVAYITDSQRAALRALPRPAKGCRCGAPDHEYVNNINCPLYSNLRALAPSGFNESLEDENATISLKFAKDLNAMEKAYKDRYVKMKTEQKAQEREAKFVSMMEDIQVKERKQAIFAPSLQSMVLSAVVEIQHAFDDLHLDLHESKTAPSLDLRSTNVEEKVVDPTSIESDDDDDDVPLALLGKRLAKGEDGSTKRPRQEFSVRLCFIARLLKEISVKWGHVYREPTDEEYAWRWEVYHGQTSTTSTVWDANSKNPRKPGSLSLECIRFGIVDEFPANLDIQSLPSLQNETSLHVKLLAALASPEFSGVVDELQALIRMGVFHVDATGVPRLAEDWWNQVDLLILEDMNNLWSLKADPHGKFGVVDEIRVPLKEKWRRTRDGWVMTDEPDDIVFDFDEFDVWREAFEEKQQEEQDDDEGIGKFGI